MKRVRFSDQRPCLKFNMVEIVVALIIIMVAMIGILGVIPTSIESNTSAVNRSNAIDAADQFLHYMGSRLETDWAVADAFPETKPGAEEDEITWSDNSLMNNTGVGDNLEIQIYYDTPDMEAAWSPDMHQNGLFRLVQTTENGSLKDFDGVLRVWKEVFEVGPGGELTEVGDSSENNGNKGNKGNSGNDGNSNGNNNGNTNRKRWRKNGKVILAHYPPGRNGEKCITLCISENAVDAHLRNHEYDHLGFCDEDLDEEGNPITRALICVLNAEVSWPAHVPYAQRSKAVYQLEIAKPSAAWVDALDLASADDDNSDEDTDDEDSDDDELFTIDDGQIILNEAQNAVVKNLGCAITYGGEDCYVTTYFNINGSQVNPFGNPNNPRKGNINDGAEHSYDAGLLEAGSTIDVTGLCYLPDRRLYMEKASSPTNQNVKVLRDGDSVPNLEGMDDQADVEAYVSDYIDVATGKITLAENQAILLFELGTSDMNSPAADFQDMVMLVTLTPED